ncbi:MAG TPA: xanthine dehydrogenase family protein molybdopterin-binding subunit [Gemmatimonadaceae bacterium]
MSAPVRMTGRAAAPSVGAPLNRVDGRLKVTGGARYAAEFAVPNVAHAVIVTSTIAKGRVRRMDTAAAERAPGVLAVLTPQNAPRLPQQQAAPGAGPAMRVPTLMQDDAVHYNGQPIGLVIADTFEHATAAANLVKAEYAEERPELDVDTAPYAPSESTRPVGNNRRHSQRGDTARGLAEAEVKIEHTYTTPFENHNPMEPHNTQAAWDGDKLTLYDSTQGIFNIRNSVARAFGIPPENVRVVSYFTGGGFGSKGGPWSHVYLAAMAAKHVSRPVKLVLTRRQMFGPSGGRAHTSQQITLGAKRDGSLTVVRHLTTATTSTLEDFLESSGMMTRMMYESPNIETDHELVRMNVGSPTFMRAPGESTGSFALESAMDELAIALGMDPVELRLKNYAERDPESGKPWSSKSLRECYRVGAERFGWSKRSPKPRSMQDGRWLVGYGVATATYPARQQAASCLARILPDGKALVRAGSQEIGCGTYTIMAQVAADALGMPVERVRFELGDTDMPPTPASVGSATASSTGPAVNAAALAARQKLVQMAITDSASPVHGAREDDVRTADGRLSLSSDPSKGETFEAVIARNGGQPVEARVDLKPTPDQQQYSMHSFGAVFTEVRVDRDLGLIRVPRVVAAYGGGKILNVKTATSQMIGGIVWGISQALLEETHIDRRSGRYVNSDLAEYHVPVNADIGSIDVTFVPEDDAHVNAIGAKGVGEIPIVGVAGSIANAVYHATGKRIRDLPITLDKLIA